MTSANRVAAARNIARVSPPPNSGINPTTGTIGIAGSLMRSPDRSGGTYIIGSSAQFPGGSSSTHRSPLQQIQSGTMLMNSQMQHLSSPSAIGGPRSRSPSAVSSAYSSGTTGVGGGTTLLERSPGASVKPQSGSISSAASETSGKHTVKKPPDKPRGLLGGGTYLE
ncbi:unnamed protein product [Amoebophrya sp. A25]|nr:unnamed protein product [Amoebophrya sp. A25]|eukprot:GSA25T00025060001.1